MTPVGLRDQLKSYALALPEAYEDHPWGEEVVKVRKKVFAFLGTPDSADPGMTVKLPASQPLALAQPGVTPSRYGLGDSGWVTVRFAEAGLPFELLRDWVDESYRSVAPKRASAARPRPTEAAT